MIRKAAVMFLLMTSAFAGDLTPKVQAKLIQILANSAASANRVACRDSEVTAALTEIGASIDATSRVSWAGSAEEVKALKGKLIICGKLEWLALGGSIAIVEEGGRPQIYLHMGNIAASGVTLGEGVLKIGKKFK